MTRHFAGWVTHHWTKWVVLAIAIIMLVVFGSLAGKLTGAQENDTSAWLPGDAESTQVIEESRAFTDPEAAPAVILYERESGITPADSEQVAADVRSFKGMDEVSGEVFGPVPSDDGQALQVLVPLDVGDGWEVLPDLIDELEQIANDGNGGLEVSMAGPAALGADQADVFSGVDGILLIAAVGVVVVMLLITYRSPILWIIPLLCGGASLAISQGIVYLLATEAGLTVNAQSASILTVLVFGAGTDYALLLIARYREELRRVDDRHVAMGHALHRAGPAIIASGATVVVGLLCLVFAQMNSTSSMGPVAAAGIVVALLVMLTLLPALLVIVGRWAFWPLVPHFGDPEPNKRGFWARVGRRIAKAPRATWLVTTVMLAFFTLGAFQLDADGLTNEELFITDQPSVAAEKRVAQHYPGGAGSPVVVIAPSESAQEVSTEFGNVQGIAPDTVKIMGQNDGITYMEGTLAAPPDSPAAFDTIDRVRDAVHDIGRVQPIVGGATAVNHDIQDASAADNRLIIPIILVAVLLILAVLLRALVAPLILLATVVLSFGAAVGISGFVFTNIFGFAGADSSFPLFAFVFLVALGIDYNIFLMTRVREEALKVGTRRGALIGLSATGGVITSAGLVLAGTFAALGTLPMVFIAELGFAVAVGVLLDTIIVRSVLVTALNLDIGRHMWWPSALAQKRDVETPSTKTQIEEPVRV
ncbi:MMPL family transporter [Aeromicrobium sp.]|uniref:MMPL family transporter n=1 Tax=Aeromicrobium sp. TaxID=1871063 RepID=UPI003D6C0AE3